MWKVTEEMIRPIGVDLSLQLWNQAHTVDGVIGRIFCSGGIEDGGIDIHHRSDLLIVHFVLCD